MIQRRHFIGAAGAVLAGGMLPRTAAANNKTEVKWESSVIRTVPRSDAERCPVVTGVSLSPGGKQMAIVGDDHIVGIYDYENKNYVHHVDAHRDWVRTAVYSPSGKQLATAGNDRTLMIWGVGNWKQPELARRHDDAIIEIAFSPSGDAIATVGFEKTLRVYSTRTGRVVKQLDCPCPDNHAVAFSADGQFLAAGGRCGTVRIWSMDNGKVVGNIKAHRQRIRSLDFLADGRLVSASDDRVVKTIDVESAKVSAEMPRLASKLFAAEMMQNDVLATAGSDNLIHLWRLRDRKELGVLKGHTGTVSCLAANANVLVSGSFDTHVRVWKVEPITGQPLERRALQGGWNGLK